MNSRHSVAPAPASIASTAPSSRRSARTAASSSPSSRGSAVPPRDGPLLPPPSSASDWDLASSASAHHRMYHGGGGGSPRSSVRSGSTRPRHGHGGVDPNTTTTSSIASAGAASLLDALGALEDLSLDLKTRNESLDVRNRDLAHQARALAQLEHSLARRAAELDARSATLDARDLDLADREDALARRLADYDAMLAAHAKSLDDADAAASGTAARVASLEAYAAELQAALRSAARNNKRLQVSVRELTGAARAMRDEVGQRDAVVAEQAARVDALTRDLRQTKTHLRTLKLQQRPAAATAADPAPDAARTAVHLRAQIASLSTDLAQADVRAHHLESQLLAVARTRDVERAHFDTERSALVAFAEDLLAVLAATPATLAESGVPPVGALLERVAEHYPAHVPALLAALAERRIGIPDPWRAVAVRWMHDAKPGSTAAVHAAVCLLADGPRPQREDDPYAASARDALAALAVASDTHPSRVLAACPAPLLAPWLADPGFAAPASFVLINLATHDAGRFLAHLAVAEPPSATSCALDDASALVLARLADAGIAYISPDSASASADLVPALAADFDPAPAETCAAAIRHLAAHDSRWLRDRMPRTLHQARHALALCGVAAVKCPPEPWTGHAGLAVVVDHLLGIAAIAVGEEGEGVRILDPEVAGALFHADA
ncbi:hypothetical protein H9P43_008129 [Blastocladiella emersonii ATCC 22665]|nr:hypothetical protein H9P43_008129 [Blastocladiella emersonii ATCC 22665]